MVHQSAGDFVPIVVRRGQPTIRLGPHRGADQDQRVAARGPGLGGPGSVAHGAGLPREHLVCQQSDQREEGEEGRCGAGDGLVRPLPLSSQRPGARGSPRK